VPNYNKKSRKITGKSIKAVPGAAAVNYNLTRAGLTLSGTGGEGLEITADGTSTILALIQASAMVSDISAMTIDSEPTEGTPEHEAWAAEFEGLATVPANGAKVIVQGKFTIECWEEQV
jgi:hypothetical protein